MSKYKWKRCSKKKCCKQRGQVKLIGTMTKWHVQEHHKHGVYKDATYIKKKLFLCFSDFSGFFYIFNFQLLKGLLQKCWITALVRSMKNIRGLKQFSAAANLTLSQHFLEKKKKRNVHSFWNTVILVMNIFLVT